MRWVSKLRWIGYAWDNLGGAVWFISENNDRDRFIAVVKGLRNPKLLNIFQRWWVGGIIHHYYAVSAFVVSWSNCSESFLAGCIPDLEFDIFLIVLDRLESEVNSDRGQVVFWEFIVGELSQDGSLAHSWTPNQDQFNKVVVLNLLFNIKIIIPPYIIITDINININL